MIASHEINQLSLFSREVLSRLLTLATAAGGVLGSVVLIMYLQEQVHEGVLLEQQERQRADQKFEFLTSEIAIVRSDLLYLAEQELLSNFLAGDKDARHKLERQYVSFATRRSIYDQIRFLDDTGKEIIRVNFRDGQAETVPEDKLQAKADRYYYRDAVDLKPGSFFVSEFDLNVEHGKIERPLRPVLRFLAPVVDNAGSTRGLMALNYSGHHLLRRLNDMSSQASTFLVNSAGQYIHGPTPTDAWGWLLGHSETFPGHFSAAWEQIAGESAGQFVTSEGMFTFRRLSFPQTSPLPRGTIQFSEAHPHDDSASSLILIAFVPAELQYANSTKLLKHLIWMYVGAMTLFVTIGWYWARSAAIRKRQAKSIQASEGRLRALSEQLLTAQEEERRCISRELHDELGQQVTAISLDLRSAVRHHEIDQLKSLLERAIEETDHLLTSLHNVAARMRPSVLDDLGLHVALETLTAEIGQRSGVTVTTKLDFSERSVSPKIGENVYRILQEGLTNVVKHAQTKESSVVIRNESDQLRITLEDRGVGFNPRQRDLSGLGILGIQERTELLGGQFDIYSAPGAGTRIEISIPLRNVSSLTPSGSFR